MFNKLLIKQTSGSKLNFAPSSTMGFTSGNNYIVISFDTYKPGGTTVSLSFHSAKPAQGSLGLFTTSTSFNIDDVLASEPFSVNAALEGRIANEVIDYLKNFNTGCDFEQDYFEVQS